MLSASPSITFPQSTSPTSSKRPKPHDHDPPKSRPRVNAPFVEDDDDDDDEDSNTAAPELEYGQQHDTEPQAKKQMLEHDIDVTLYSTSTASRPSNNASNEEESQSIPSGNATTDAIPSLWSSQRPLFSQSLLTTLAPTTYTLKSCTGQAKTIKERTQSAAVTYESMVAARSKTKEGRAKRAYYGIDIHELVNAASKENCSRRQLQSDTPAPNAAVPSIEKSSITGRKTPKSLLWTEKYRARTFMDLCGDDGTNRLVLRWLKKWDPLVFPGATKSRPVVSRRPKQESEEEKPHKKILMLTGAPGLGKTTLAHVCARQAGYEVMEINASDDRSRDVVKNRIRTSLGTESVKNVSNRKDATGERSQRVAKPACVVVDEVDGVVSGAAGSGEGGFVKALIDLVLLDQKNCSGDRGADGGRRKKQKGDDFRQMRPLILICNDVYHPSLRPLRQSGLAEIIHTGRPSFDAVVGRLKSIFEKENIPCDKDAARKLCEAAWGMSSGLDAKKGAESTVEGDLRGVMVVGEWVAGRFRASSSGNGERLTRQWIERNVLHDLASGAAGSRGLGRGSVKDIVNRLFQEGGGFPKQAMDLSTSKNQHEQPQTELGFGEQQKKHTMARLGQMADTSGEISFIMTEIFAEYPNREFNDDSYLTKPNQAYEWLHFHDTCQSRLYASQEWELAPYLGQPVLACHHLFASPKRHYGGAAAPERRWGQDAAQADDSAPLPFTGPRADFQAHEAEKQNRAQLQAMQSQLSPSLMRSFRSAEDMATDLLPYLVRLVSPDVKPVVVGGSQGTTASVRKDSERVMVKRAAEVLADIGVALQKGKIESGNASDRNPQFVYRMDPDLDALSTFETNTVLLPSQAPTRYAVRQVLDQELRRATAQREASARQARFLAGGGNSSSNSGTASAAARFLPFDNKENARPGVDAAAAAAKTGTLVKRDFFGRVVEAKPLAEVDGNSKERRARREETKVWVTYHEGLNNAVRKPMSLQEFLRGL